MAMKHFVGSNPRTSSGISRVLRVLSYSTKIPSNSLQVRISQAGNSQASVVSILNQWLEEGEQINKTTLIYLIRWLRNSRRFSRALQVSEWMSEAKKYDITALDMVIRLDLISKVHGLHQAEKFFDSLPSPMRTFEVYNALLNCYAQNKCLEKAEATMQNIRELGFPINAFPYNVMLNLYRHLGKHEMLDVLVQEMEEKGIKNDEYTTNIRLNAYASSRNTEGMEKLLAKMENDAQIPIDAQTYVVAANGYVKARLTEKALQILNKAEQLVTPERRMHDYEVFISVYTNLGKKDEVYRIWELYGNLGKFRNSGYLCMISSLLKLDDLDGAEKILSEWESRHSVFDPRIIKVMISAYCKRGFIEKAEAYTNNLVERGAIKKPDAFILNSLATGYQKGGQMAKAVETLKKAILASTSGWKANIATLAACLKHLKRKNDIEAAEELLKLFRDRGHFSTDAYNKLLMNIRDRNLDASTLDLIKGNNETVDEESTSALDQIKGDSETLGEESTSALDLIKGGNETLCEESTRIHGGPI